MDNFKKIFGVPEKMNWGYPVLFMAIGTGLTFLLDRVITAKNGHLSMTSVAGFTLIQLFLVIISMILPAVIVSRNNPSRTIGSYTGIGMLVLAFVSGAPVSIMMTSVRNFIIYLWLKLGNSIVYPTFFCVDSGTNTYSIILSILSGTVIPALGASIFFFGAMQEGVRKVKPDKLIGAFIVALFYAVFALDLLSLPGLFLCGLWLYYLRDRADNIFAPFVCLLGVKATKYIVNSFIADIDITQIQTYSDIDKSFFYAILPAFLIAVFLLLIFVKYMDESYNTRLGFYRNSDEDRALAAKFNTAELNEASSYKAGFNIPFLMGIVICIALWVLILKGY